MKKVRITLIKGTVRRLPVHRANVKALGENMIFPRLWTKQKGGLLCR